MTQATVMNSLEIDIFAYTVYKYTQNIYTQIVTNNINNTVFTFHGKAKLFKVIYLLFLSIAIYCLLIISYF